MPDLSSSSSSHSAAKPGMGARPASISSGGSHAASSSKIPVAVLGATGAVGQRFVRLLADHPWFEVVAVAASDRSVGRRYTDAANWVIPGDPPPDVARMIVQPMEPTLPGRIVFSALPGAAARGMEPAFARAGYAVCSNASAYRQEPGVPLLIPEVNARHVDMIPLQRAEKGWPGLLVTSPNCTTTGIVMPLKPLDEAFGLEKVFAVSMQAISGGGYPGVASLDILGNVVPYIRGEEEKIEQETRLLLGRIQAGRRVEADLAISAQANRVPILDGHTICLSLGFRRAPKPEEAMEVLSAFRGPEVVRTLPSAPAQPILVRHEPDRPQPRRDRDAAGGMAVTVGRVRSCPLLDLRLVSVSHNTLRGAASGSILNAELLVASGYVEREA
jgi:aspartate-semialdehyde dehydrogenase